MGHFEAVGCAQAGRRSLLSASLLILGILGSATIAAAEPIRIIVNFTVVGSAADPDLGSATASGSFSVVTDQALGTEVVRPAGFGAEVVSFTWGGATWDATNADVYLIGRELSGRVGQFGVGGSPSGFGGISSGTSPDFRITFCITDDFECSQITFDYATDRSAELGIFTGFIPNLSIERQPLDAAPVPEPLTCLLVGSGLCAMVTLRRIRASGGDPLSDRRP